MSDSFLKHSKEILPGIDIEGEIGRGASAVVYKARDPNLNRRYALKIIQNINQASKDNFKREKDILVTVSHRNIIKLYQIVEFNNEAALLLEYASGGELFDRIVERTCYSEHDAAECLKQILSGLQHLHDKGIVHRDLKPENLLYESEANDAPLKIADFGLGTIQKEGVHKMFTICGTPGYCAPEILCSVGYTEKVDVWSAGVILYILLCGYEPFSDDTKTDKEMFKHILNGYYHFHSPEWDDITDAAKDLVRKMLVVDPKKRLSVYDALRHPWIVAETNSTRELPVVTEKLKDFNHRRRLKTPMHAIAAVNAFRVGNHQNNHDCGSISPSTATDNDVTAQKQQIANGI